VALDPFRRHYPDLWLGGGRDKAMSTNEDIERITRGDAGGEYASMGCNSSQASYASSPASSQASYASSPAEADALLHRAIEGLVSGALTYRGERENISTLQQSLDAIGAAVLRELTNRRNRLIDQINEAKFVRAENVRVNDRLVRVTNGLDGAERRARNYATVLDDITALFVPDGLSEGPLPGELALYIAKRCVNVRLDSVEGKAITQRCLEYIEQHTKRDGAEVQVDA
jgi:chorismate mutase